VSPRYDVGAIAPPRLGQIIQRAQFTADALADSYWLTRPIAGESSVPFLRPCLAATAFFATARRCSADNAAA
jgi:hypothetical protein